MCGIVVAIAKYKAGLSQKHISVFNQMLFVDQLRGSDGTGVFYDTRVAGECLVLKDNVASSRFMGQPRYNKAAEQWFHDSTFLVGHNRAATKGETTWKNTHPFVSGDITLIHNGTLWAHKHLADVDVDSHAICISIDKIGIEETLLKLDGAFVLVYHDAKDDTINIVKNDKRPLAMIETDNCYYFMSELAMGEWIVGRNRETIKNSYEVKSKQLSTFSVIDRTFETKDVKFKEPLPPAKKPVYPSYSAGSWTTATSAEEQAVKGYSDSYLPAILKGDDSRILVYPVEVLMRKGIAFGVTGLYVDEKTDADIEVRYYCNEAEAIRICNYSQFHARIAQTGTDVTKSIRFVIVKDPKEVIETVNGHLLRSSAIIALPTECSCCGGKFSKTKLHLQKSAVYYTLDKNGKRIVNCHACVEDQKEIDTTSLIVV